MTSCEVCDVPLRQPPRGRRRRYCSRSCQARAYRARRGPAAPPRRYRPARLTTVGIARTAVALADHTGLDGLSMRRLAGELGVATAALYRHFADREHLLAAMVDLVLTEIPEPPPDLTGWRARLRHEALQEWRLYRRHPWMLMVLARTRPPLGPALFDTLERALSALDELDLPRADLLAAYLSCSGLVQGLALLWTSERADRIGATADTEPPPGLTELIDAVARPTLHKIFVPADTVPELDFDELLATAVDMLLDGVAVRYRTATE